MSRLYSAGTWSFGSLAIALALLVPLTVPEGALADAGSTCGQSCQSTTNIECGGDPKCIAQQMGPCTGSCCSGACNGDSSCDATCCSEACGSTTNDCYNTCTAYVGGQDSQCPNKNVTPYGCLNAGAPCYNFGTPSTCQPVKTNTRYCDCP